MVTAVAVVLLARYETEPPRTRQPELGAAPRGDGEPRAAAGAAGGARRGRRSSTPFSVIQVRATLTRGRLTGVETVELTGDGPHTDALNARAEPILRAEALEAGSADIDVVTGATYTSESWRESLQAAIDAARRRASDALSSSRSGARST